MANAFANRRRATYDVYEFQELVEGTWVYSHTDCGYYQMLENRAAYDDNYRLGGNTFRIVKRRAKKAELNEIQLRWLEIYELKAKMLYLNQKIEEKPESQRRKSWERQIQAAEIRIKSLKERIKSLEE